MGKTDTKIGYALAMAMMLDPTTIKTPWYRRRHSMKSIFKSSSSNPRAHQGAKEMARRVRQMERGILKP